MALRASRLDVPVDTMSSSNSHNPNVTDDDARRRLVRDSIAALCFMSTASTALTTAPCEASAQTVVPVAVPAPAVPDPMAPITIQKGSSSSSSIVPFYKFETVDQIPTSYFDEHRILYGFTERVLDGDTLRVTHVPDFAFTRQQAPPAPLPKQRGLADTTLKIRLYGIDCPELAKTKNQLTQPFGAEAQQFTTDATYHKMVKLTLLRRDRYGRAIAVVETLPSPGFLATGGGNPKDLSVELSRQGLAELYEGGGADYYVRVCVVGCWVCVCTDA